MKYEAGPKDVAQFLPVLAEVIREYMDSSNLVDTYRVQSVVMLNAGEGRPISDENIMEGDVPGALRLTTRDGNEYTLKVE
jgi:hypothetical protein